MINFLQLILKPIFFLNFYKLTSHAIIWHQDVSLQENYFQGLVSTFYAAMLLFNHIVLQIHRIWAKINTKHIQTTYYCQ